MTKLSSKEKLKFLKDNMPKGVEWSKFETPECCNPFCDSYPEFQLNYFMEESFHYCFECFAHKYRIQKNKGENHE